MDLTNLNKKIDSLDDATKALIQEYQNKKVAFHNLKMQRDSAQPEPGAKQSLNKYRELQEELTNSIDAINDLETRIMESLNPEINAGKRLDEEKKDYLVEQNERILDTTDFYVKCFIIKDKNHSKHNDEENFTTLSLDLSDDIIECDKIINDRNEELKSLHDYLAELEEEEPDNLHQIEITKKSIETCEQDISKANIRKLQKQKQLQFIDDAIKMDLSTLLYYIDRNKATVASNLREMGLADVHGREKNDRINKTTVAEYRKYNNEIASRGSVPDKNIKVEDSAGRTTFGGDGSSRKRTSSVPATGKYTENNKILTPKEMQYLSEIYYNETGKHLDLSKVKPAGKIRTLMTWALGDHRKYNKATIDFLNEVSVDGNYSYSNLFSDVNTKSIATLIKAGVTTNMLIDVRRKIQNDINKIESKDSNKFLDDLINWNREVSENEEVLDADLFEDQTIQKTGSTKEIDVTTSATQEIDSTTGSTRESDINLRLLEEIEKLNKRIENFEQQINSLNNKVDELTKENEALKKEKEMLMKESENGSKNTELFSDRREIYDNIDKIDKAISELEYDEEEKEKDENEEYDTSNVDYYRQKREESESIYDYENMRTLEDEKNNEDFLSQDISAIISSAKVQKAAREAGCNTVKELRDKLLQNGQIAGVGAVTLNEIDEKFTANKMDIPFLHKLFKRKGENIKIEIPEEEHKEYINSDYQANSTRFKEDEDEER